MLSGVGLLPVGYVEPFTLLFQNLRYGTTLHAPLICYVLLPNPRILLVVEANLLALVVEEPLFARLANELLERFPCGVLENWPFNVGPYTSPFGETSDGRGNTVRGRDSTGAEARSREEGEGIGLGGNRRSGV